MDERELLGLLDLFMLGVEGLEKNTLRTAKIKTVNGLRIEIFIRKYYPSMDGLDRWNDGEVLIVLSRLV